MLRITASLTRQIYTDPKVSKILVYKKKSASLIELIVRTNEQGNKFNNSVTK